MCHFKSNNFKVNCMLLRSSLPIFTGLFPVIFNLAKDAKISVNATCGETKNETYCRLVEHVPNHMEEQYAQCKVCYEKSPDETERHPIENAIDGTGSWWQSPSLVNGLEYHHVTITLDLKQVRSFEIHNVIYKGCTVLSKVIPAPCGA